MRKYYLFIIRNDYYKMYKKNSLVLYNTLYNLYKLSKKDFSYGIYLYNQVCQLISKDLLTNYIKRKYKYKKIGNKILKLSIGDEITNIQINKSCIVILTNKNIPQIFKTFYIYNKKIFVCDFFNEDYFWLNEQIKKVI